MPNLKVIQRSRSDYVCDQCGNEIHRGIRTSDGSRTAPGALSASRTGTQFRRGHRCDPLQPRTGRGT